MYKTNYTIDITQEELLYDGTGSRANALLIQKAHTMNSKLESVPFTIPKADNLLGTTLKNSQFFMQRQVLGKGISTDGYSAMAIIPFNGGYKTEVIRPMVVEMVGNREYYVTGVTSEKYHINHVPYSIWIESGFKNGVPYLHKYVSIINPGESAPVKKFIEKYDVTYVGLDFLPVKVFKNNYKMDSDCIEYGVGGLLQQLTELDKEYIATWHISKSFPMYNTNLSDVDPQSETKALREGKSYIAEDGYNAKMGMGIDMKVGDSTSQLLTGLIFSLTEEIKEKLALARDNSATGSQKNTLEIVLKKDYMIEQTIIKLNARQAEYDDFFFRLCKILNVKIIKPKLQPSFVDNATEQYLTAAIAGELAKATQPKQAQQAEPEGETDDQSSTTTK